MRRQLRVELGIHCHNDCDVAVANTLAAVATGATQVQGTINGIGERCGNVDLVSVIANLALKRGHEVLLPGSLARLTEVSRYVYETANMNFRTNQPFVGASAFAHKGGMHTHAVARNTASYEHIDPAAGRQRAPHPGQRTVRPIDDPDQDDEVRSSTHDRALMQKILNQVQDLENEGYEFEAAEASFDLLVQEGGGAVSAVVRAAGATASTSRPGRTAGRSPRRRSRCASAARCMHTVSEGDGPVNALDGALRKALLPFYPRLAEMHLVDYKVRVVNARAETAARVRVVIEWRDGDDVWGTVGVSENIIEASWLALVDAFEYKLFKDEEARNTIASVPRREVKRRSPKPGRDFVIGELLTARILYSRRDEP